MKITRKIIALLLCVAMVFALGSVAFADSSDRPTSHTAVSSLTGISSVTVAGTTAYYEYDDNTGSSVKYIRAMVPNTVSLEGLQAATVVITTTGCTPTVKFNNSTKNATSQAGNVYTYTLDLLNKRYSVSVTVNNTTYTYWLAAGFAGHVAIDTNDTLGIQGASIEQSTLSVYASVAQGFYPGNTYYVNNSIDWTDLSTILYYIKGGFTYNGSLDSVPINLSISNGASINSGGCIVDDEGDYYYDFNATSQSFSLSYGQSTRTYLMDTTTASSTKITISESNYKINMSELSGDSTYGESFATNISQIQAALIAYYASTPRFNNSDSVMDVMLDFIDFAESHSYFSYETYCSDTYLSTLNGVGEFSAGWMSGWMYMDGAYSSNCTVANVGAADYLLGAADLFTWFYTTNYTNHYSGW